MYCENCRSELSQRQKFCKNCGQKRKENAGEGPLAASPIYASSFSPINTTEQMPPFVMAEKGKPEDSSAKLRRWILRSAIGLLLAIGSYSQGGSLSSK